MDKTSKNDPSQGRIRNIELGKIIGSPLYGYKLKRRIEGNNLITGEREIDNDQAKIVRLIFDMFINGHTISQICKYLNDNNIPSSRNKKWHSNFLVGSRQRKNGLIRQTLYAGTYTYNKLKFITKNGKRKCYPRPKTDWITHDFPELAIIDKYTFDKAQKILDHQEIISKQNKIKKERQQKKTQFLNENPLFKKEDEIRHLVKGGFSVSKITRFIELDVTRSQVDYFIKTRILKQPQLDQLDNSDNDSNTSSHDTAKTDS